MTSTTAATTPAARTATHVSAFPTVTASIVHVITTSTTATTKATADSSLFMRDVAVSTYLCAYVLGASPDLAFATCLALRTRTICAMPPNDDAKTSSGAAQSTAQAQSLTLLNTRSASIGSWDLCVFNPQVTTYQWTDKTSQQVKTNQIFRCLLLD